MATICSQCSHVNPDQSGFCIRCGNRLPVPGQTGQFGPGSFNPGANSTSFPTYVSPQSAPPTTGNWNSGGSLPTYASVPSSPTTGTQQPPSFPSNTGYLPPSGPTNPPPWSTSTLAPPPPGPQMGSMQSLASLRRAFAGHGTLVMHYSWLLPGEHAHTNAVRDAVRERLRQRAIPKLNANPEMLTERGVLMEEREYVVAQRGVASVFTYVAPAGQDLYISRASTVLPAISNVRIIVVGLLALLMLIGFASHPSPETLYTNPTGYIFSTIFSGLSYPIILFFVAFLIRSFISWIFEDDFWQLLRRHKLNDFQLDDWALLEHVTDDVVRAAVEQVGLDATLIKPPQEGYRAKSKIRAV